MESISHHTTVVHSSYHYLHLLIAPVQEVVSGEWDVCGRQHDGDHWIAPSHDPVMMGGLSRRGDAPDKPGRHEDNVDAGYPPGGRRINAPINDKPPHLGRGGGIVY